MTDRLADRPRRCCRRSSQEELGLSEDRLAGSDQVRAHRHGRPPGLGALIPVLPFLFLAGQPALIASAVVSILAHFGVGAAQEPRHAAQLVAERASR